MPAGADAVVMVERHDEHWRRRRGRFSQPATSGPEHRPARRATSPPATSSSAAGDLLTPSRVGALAAIGCTDVEVYAQPARRDPVDRQRGRRAGTAARARADLRRQPLHARRRRRRARRRAGAASRRPRHARGAARARSTNARTRIVIVFSGGSSVGERDLIVDSSPRAAR